MENHPWSTEAILEKMNEPLFTLVQESQLCTQRHFNPREIECCTLLNIKTGACPEDCSYCSQSAHYKTNLNKEPLIEMDKLIKAAKAAKSAGAQRFCMGAAWRSPPKKAMPTLIKMIKIIRDLGLESCVTLGMLSAEQVTELEAAGLDYYSHNLDTSPRYYSEIIKTRTYQDRLDTLTLIADSNINICCGGIVGMGETREDRAELLHQLSCLKKVPKSIPINQLLPMPGTPLANAPPIDSFEYIKMIAIARIMFPTSMIRLAAGREMMSKEMQAWCFMAGVNSIFIGDKLLTANNNSLEKDQELLAALGLQMTSAVQTHEKVATT